ncbi:MAG: hypothetical protein ABR563_15865 [Pyrinomonadaceae bacterium]
MRESLSVVGRALALALCVAGAAAAQGQPKGQGAAQPSEGETKAAQAVQSAADVASAATAAQQFVKKYPKSSLRPQVARIVAGKLAAVPDPAQRATLGEQAVKVFDRPEELDVINPVLINAYIESKRADDAFRVAAAWLEKNPEDVQGLTQMALTGIDQARIGNGKFVAQSQQYATKAISLIEADKRPAATSAADWAAFKTQWLPQLYQSLGLLAYVTGDGAEARARLEKAVALGVTDPTSYALLADMTDKEYSEAASKINAMPAGAEHDAAMQRAQEQLDKVIESYARAVALTEGKAGFEKMHDQMLASLTSYYKYRKGSTDGMQQLIDKYKKPAGVSP